MNAAEALFTPTLDSNQMDDEINAAGAVGNLIPQSPPGANMPDNVAQAAERRFMSRAWDADMLTPGGLDDSVVPIQQDKINLNG